MNSLILFYRLIIAGSFIYCFAHEPCLAKVSLLENLGTNIDESFMGSNLLLHAAGIGSTVFIVRTGIDAKVRDTYRHSKNEGAIPGAILGSGLVAVGLASTLYFDSVEADSLSQGAAVAILQSAAITVTYVIFLKITTGRAHPTNDWNLSSQDQSQQWQFGLMRNGPTAYGWPSGHVSHVTAVMSALAHYYPEKSWLRWTGYSLVAYMLYAVSAFDSGQMHWFSDGVAGAFFGYAIGSTVGKNLRANRHTEGTFTKTTPKSQWSFLPILAPKTVGLSVQLSF
ncbi:MAG: phosphatase PAP2 family protein [Oligoflexia bacterium]|nr:phosphatase PAP2 family protein [Oligoflexia bacterium]